MSTPSVVSIDDTEMRVAAQRSTDELAERVGRGLDLPVEAYMGRGGPAEVLIAASEAADLLVLGSRGRGGFARLILGSTSTQCATHASVPTVVVPEGAHPVGTRRILVGFDGSPNATEALRWAVQFATPGSTVVAAWVWDATPLAVGADAFFFPDASDLAAERFHHLLEPIQALADRVGVTLEREFLRGTPRAVLATQSDGVDLVVVGARGHGSVGAALLGSVSTWILHHVHRPVAVVPVGVYLDDGLVGTSAGRIPRIVVAMSDTVGMIRVFLLDDHEVVRGGITAALDAEEDMVVVGQCGDVSNALAEIARCSPDVAVLDVRLEDGSGIDVCRQITATFPEVKSLILTSFDSDRALVDAGLAGASGFVLKQIRSNELIETIRGVAAGRRYLDDAEVRLASRRLRDSEEGRLDDLTPQERRIFDLIGQGYTNRQIAQELYLAEKTVKNYVSNLLAKLGMSRRTEAAALSARLVERHRNDS